MDLAVLGKYVYCLMLCTMYMLNYRCLVICCLCHSVIPNFFPAVFISGYVESCGQLCRD